MRPSALTDSSLALPDAPVFDFLHPSFLAVLVPGPLTGESIAAQEAESDLVHVTAVARGQVRRVDEREQGSHGVHLGRLQTRMVLRLAIVAEQHAIPVDDVDGAHRRWRVRTRVAGLEEGRPAADDVEVRALDPALGAAAPPIAFA